MRRLTNWTLGVFTLLTTLNLVVTCVATVWSVGSDDIARELVSIGNPGPDAVKFKIWTNKEDGEVFHPGDRVILNMMAEQQAYATILAVSADGDVTLVFPNKLMKDNVILPGKVYTLFGDDSPVIVTTGNRPSKGKLVIYLNSKPFVVDPFKIPDNVGWLTILGRNEKEIDVLKGKLQAFAQQEGFNCATVLLPNGTTDNLEIKLSEVSPHAARKSIESSIPENLTGTAGLKTLREEKQMR